MKKKKKIERERKTRKKKHLRPKNKEEMNDVLQLRGGKS